MIATIVHVWVKKNHLQDFIEASLANHRESVKEQGNIRFDILQDATDPCKFTLYEAYTTEAAAAAHKDTPHYKQWRALVAPWMEKPREGIKHNMLAPQMV